MASLANAFDNKSMAMEMAGMMLSLRVALRGLPSSAAERSRLRTTKLPQRSLLRIICEAKAARLKTS